MKKRKKEKAEESIKYWFHTQCKSAVYFLSEMSVHQCMGDKKKNKKQISVERDFYNSKLIRTGLLISIENMVLNIDLSFKKLYIHLWKQTNKIYIKPSNSKTRCMWRCSEKKKYEERIHSQFIWNELRWRVCQLETWKWGYGCETKRKLKPMQLQIESIWEESKLWLKVWLTSVRKMHFPATK